MIAVIFEVWPKPEHKQQYLDLAAELKPILETIDGFISIERFESLTEKGKILSLSFFRDEDALAAWRNVPQHRKSQSKGRATIFEGNQGERDVVGALMRHPIADQIAAAAGNDGKPTF